MPMISVIVPIYGVEKYLSRCINSLLAQTFADFELILINDGSPDACGDIINRFACLDRRVRAYHTRNHGLSAARNYGMRRARGYYTAFVDPDDFVLPTYLETLYRLMKETRADISCVMHGHTRAETVEKFCQEVQKRRGPGEEEVSYHILSGSQALADSIWGVTGAPLTSAWGKLFRTDFVRRYPFPEGHVYEDLATSYKYYEACMHSPGGGRIAVAEVTLYAYYENPGSITHRKTYDNTMDHIGSLQERVRNLRKLGHPLLARLSLIRELAVFLAVFLRYRRTCTYLVERFYRSVRDDLPGRIPKKALHYLVCHPVLIEILRALHHGAVSPACLYRNVLYGIDFSGRSREVL